MNILVSGGAGFIGSHVCKALAKHGIQPITYDNLGRGHREAVKWGPFEQGDILDSRRLREVLDRYDPAGVMHFASLTYVNESVQDPKRYYNNNVVGTFTLLNEILLAKPIPFVFSSTAAIYGIPNTIPIVETQPAQPINPYGFTKFTVERMLQDFAEGYKLPWVALRYFNAAGSDPDGEIGEVHNPETHLIPLVLMAARDHGSLQIYGTNYDTPDGTCIRDYIHVVDIAEAHVKALAHLLAGGTSCSINLANERGFSVKEVIAVAERVCKCAINVQFADRRPGDPPILIGSANRAHSVLGWAPVRSDLEIQVRDAWRWISSRK